MPDDGGYDTALAPLGSLSDVRGGGEERRKASWSALSGALSRFGRGSVLSGSVEGSGSLWSGRHVVGGDGGTLC